MKKIIYLLALTLIFTHTNNATAQSAKRFFTDAKASETTSNFEEAIDYYNKAIVLDSKYYDAYLERAKCHQKLKHYNNAMDDFKAAMGLKPEDVVPISLAANLLVDEKKYQDAIGFFKKVSDLKKKNVESVQMTAYCFLHLGEFKKAIAECEKAIQIEKESSISFLYKAMSYDSILEPKAAFENYTLALSHLENTSVFKKNSANPEYFKYYVGMGNAQFNTNLFDLAIANYTKALSIQPESNEALGLRAKAYAAKMKMKEAENDYNQAILLNDRNPDNFVGRGYVYYRLGEYEKALSDYEKAIIINKEIINAYKGKAQCLEAKNQFPEAKKSLQQAITLANKNKNYDGKILETLLANVDAKIFQTMRETNAPFISFTNGNNQKLQINVPKNALNVILEGKISDESKIEKLLIGDFEAIYNKEQINPTFSVSLNLLMKEEVEVFVQDIYGNELKTYYKIVKTEKDAPKLTLSAPMVSEGKIINIADTNGFKLKVVGAVEDESSIKSIVINGKSANYNSKQNNPSFLIDIDIVGIDSLVIDVLDEFDNKASSVYSLLRGGNSNSSTNPMGKTWVVFIDNAKYSQLPMLEATSNDVLSMKLALESYNIGKIIVRNDMTKQQMEKFFAIELRDLVNGNNVNSIMIFYAGHGKFINESGYWLPVDANRKDEFTFFNVSTLKNYLGAYKPLTHSLVVSDACETGPAFYLAMRDANKIPDCGQWEAARKKSAQVLTSTSIDLNDDKSIFTKSFVNALKSCNDKCISIERIADKIAKQSVQYQKPKPKLGIIPALNNEDESTFFFVKK